MKLKKLPTIGQKFSKVIYCSEDGEPIVVYHDVKIDNKFTAKRNPKHESYVSLASSKFYGIPYMRIYPMDLNCWRFIK